MFGQRRQKVQLTKHRSQWNHVYPYAVNAYDMSGSRLSNQQAYYGGMNPYFPAFQQQPTYHTNGYHMQNFSGIGFQGEEQNNYHTHQSMMYNNANIFQNPLDMPQENSYQYQQNNMQQNPYMNPYPKQSFLQKKPSGVQSIMNSFKGQDGSLDFNKMMDTAGSMMNAFSQVSNMVKGVGGMFKV